MLLAVRPMSREDINQVAAIDREAFPTQWPPPNYQNELPTGWRATLWLITNAWMSRQENRRSPGRVASFAGWRDGLGPGEGKTRRRNRV